MEPVFIVSCGRSGSMMLARVLNRIPQCAAFHEPPPYLAHENYRLWKNLIGAQEAHEILRIQRDPLLERVRSENRVYIESSHYLAFFIPYLQERYHPKFIHLTRDGRGFVTSGMGRRRWYFLPRLLRRLQIAIEETFHFHMSRHSLQEYHRLWPPRAARTKVEKLAWLWSEYNLSIKRMLTECNTISIHVKLEDFQDSARDTITVITDYIGVDGRDVLDDMVAICHSRPNVAVKKRFPPPSEWSRETVRQYDRWAAEASAIFGYA